jgi:UDP-3-O-acyl-N-acetylglucosamine deacetylase
VRRTDTGESWPAIIEHVVSGVHCTAIGTPESSVAYVEHALAALRAARVSDAVVETDGPELPLYDGSALAWWRALAEAGRAETSVPWEPLVLSEAVYVVAAGRAIIGLPAATLSLTYVLDLAHPLLGRQWARWGEGDDFGETLAGARTFATADQVRAMTGLPEVPPEVEGMCVVLYPDRISGTDRDRQALAHHKLVDLLGDLFLVGRPLVGQVIALKTGHVDNHRLLREVLAVSG